MSVLQTAGALWYLQGALLLLASVTAITGGEPRRTRAVIATSRPWALVRALGASELLLAVCAAPAMTIAGGVVERP